METLIQMIILLEHILKALEPPKSCTTLSISYCYQHTQIVKLSDQGGKIVTIQDISYFSQKHWWTAGPYIEVAYFLSEVV